MNVYQTGENRGFTIIEMMIALGVLAILLTVVGPALQNTAARSDLKEATDLVTQAFRITKSAARITNSSVRMELVTDGANPVINFKFLNTDDIISADGMRLPPIQLPKDISVGGDTLEFTFDPMGIIDATDTITLASTINSDHASSVEVVNNMGHVSASIDRLGEEES
jgi:prepilin-type N-terminal cleavage/methylation domain-containing protein